MKDMRSLNNPYQFCAGFGKKLLIIFLFLNSVLASPLASVQGDQAADQSIAEQEAPPDAYSEKLPFPGYQKKNLNTGYQDSSVNVVSYSNYRDPLIGVNRVIFKVNDIAYRFLMIPLAKGYARIVPDPVERCIGNFFYNIKTPIYAVNHLLQLKPKPMGRTLLRFGINTTIGLLGFFDPARTRFALEREDTYFEHTLSHYGAGYGIYLVIPFFGPSDLRRGAASIVDHFLNPIIYLTEFPISTGIQAFDNFQNFAPGAPRYNTLRRKTDDPYIFFRNLYLQGVQRDDDYQKN